jgi:hypothetical protein
MFFARLMSITCTAAIAVLLPACGGSNDAPAATVKVLSSRATLVSGGSALVEVPLPANMPSDQVKVLRNGTDVTSSFSVKDARTLVGVVEGLSDGTNEIQAVSGSPATVVATGSIKSSPLTGPLFAGPHQRPWICETEASGLGAPTSSSVCAGNSRIDWFYRTTAGTFAPLTQLSPPYPSDLAKTITTEGKSVNYIVRVESGTINESIYRIAILDDPAKPISKPWSVHGTKPGAGWNGKLMYQYVGGAGPGYRSGSNSATGSLQAQDSIRSTDDALNTGFAVATGTRNVFGTGQDDVLSAETTAMIKEHFIKNYGLPKFTIGLGSSGGSMQLHLIAQNYPGLLDGIIPVRTYPDQVSVVSDVLDCNVLTNYFTKTAATNWPVSKISKVDGYPVSADNSTTCLGLWQNFADVWQNPSNSQFAASVPVALRYNATSNPKGARGDYWSGNVNSFGVNPANGFARSAYDNVGVQYGLNALNAGAISTTEFLDLNEKVGGLDIDGKITTARSSGDLQAIANAYKSGRLNSAVNLTLPMIDYRNYVDDQKNIHARDRTFAKIERMLKTNGTRDNMVAWTVAGTPAPGTNMIRQGLTAMNEWLDKLSADPANLALDRSSLEYLNRVIAAKPATAKDACWDSVGTKFEEAATLDPAAQCNKLYPIYANPRIAAGGSRAGDVLKCQLKPLTTADYKVALTAPELARLNAIFPTGVCDWSKPGVNQSLPDGAWLSFGQTPGTWTVLGR